MSLKEITQIPTARDKLVSLYFTRVTFSFTIKTGINRGPAKTKINGKYIKNPKTYNTIKIDKNRLKD